MPSTKNTKKALVQGVVTTEVPVVHAWWYMLTLKNDEIGAFLAGI